MAIGRLFVRAILSLCLCFSVSVLALSVTFGDTSPKGRGFAPCFLIYTSISFPSSSEYIPLYVTRRGAKRLSMAFA